MKLVSGKVAVLGALFSAVVATGALLALSSTQLVYASPVAAAQNDNAPAAPANVAGKWKLSFAAPDGSPKQGELDLQQDGSSLTGTYTGPRGTFPAKGNIRGTQVTFTLSAMGRRLTFSGGADGGILSGTTENGAFWSASRE